MTKNYSIKEVAQLAGLSASNIRYYESEGLIQKICRNHAGIRVFNEQDISWIQFLAKLKDMAMPIAKMKQYAILREQGQSTIAERMELLEQHKLRMLAKINIFQENITLLDNKIELYKQLENKKNER